METKAALSTRVRVCECEWMEEEEGEGAGGDFGTQLSLFFPTQPPFFGCPLHNCDSVA
jgi:hypothetical protein